MAVAQRFLLTLAIVLAILLALAAYGYFTGGWEDDENNAHLWGLASAQTRPELCMDGETREHVRSLMLTALDDALKTKVEELFAVWLRDATGQPGRAKKGMEAALAAYSNARIAAMQFSPPECSG